MNHPITEDFSKRILIKTKELWPEVSLAIEDVVSHWGLPPKPEMGHYCLGCFFLASPLKTSPARIATELAQRWEGEEGIQEVSAQGPYLNFILTVDYLGKSILRPLLEGKGLQPEPSCSRQKIIFEYSQPNTHKILHVGHMRNLCLGNALTKILRHQGHDVVTATYPGDVGTHVAKCLWYLENRVKKEDYPIENKGDWLGDIYTRAVQSYSEEEHAGEVTEILNQICDQKGDYFQLWEKTRQWSVDLMKRFYDWAEVDFDHWYWESEMDAPSLAWAEDLYRQGVLVKDEGAIGMDLESEKLGFCLLVKKDGTGLYATKDLELARRKLEEFRPDHNIYLVDNRQSRHFSQIFAVLKRLGIENADKCRHLEYEMVELATGAMSSRLGNIIPLSDLIVQMEGRIVQGYLAKYREGAAVWSSEEIQETAKMIANGAIKYGMVRMDNNRKIVFNMDEWLKLDGETGPYLQYTYARIQSLKRKLGELDEANLQWELLRDECETRLLIQLGEFSNVVERCARQFKTAPLCTYLYELSKGFNSFYNQCPIRKAETASLGQIRLALSGVVGEILKVGLSLLGIQAPAKM